MGIYILIILGYFLLKFCGKILRKVCSVETTALWLAVLFCWLLLGLVLGGCNNIGMALHLDTGSQVSRATSEAIQTNGLWGYKLEQSHSMGNSPSFGPY